MLLKTIILITSTTLGAMAAAVPWNRLQIIYSDDEITQIESTEYFNLDTQTMDYDNSPVYKYASEVTDTDTYQDPTDERHKVTLINNCGSGVAVYTDYDHPEPRGNGTYQGLVSGIAYLEDFDGAHCRYGGVNCGAVQFTLSDGSGHGMMNSANYDLMDAPGFGNHKFHYKMNFRFEGQDCNQAADGPCTGGTPAQCPGGFFGGDWYSGRRTECRGPETGIIITFC
ncbi:uncharacterized protein I303_103899 [Kwoniella dejecticola CBS 10117]|uniref:Uncharacterized protein n=1 Tax=Kwoniella dejecticola CBS 10117 TaxID=1296121 RepID=A0A1A6A809_9TREE|nr:uncharacterized protein I303_03918 [Kwoniella dejecticola CBS 10117]OBR86198.1 hypothetical protein I303_03918 [Kwoniella dejecticola CBS 10117]